MQGSARDANVMLEAMKENVVIDSVISSRRMRREAEPEPEVIGDP